MRAKKNQGPHYYADLFDASGRRWRVPLHTRDPRVAQQRFDKLKRKQRAVKTALLQAHPCRVIGPTKACKQISADMEDWVEKSGLFGDLVGK